MLDILSKYGHKLNKKILAMKGIILTIQIIQFYFFTNELLITFSIFFFL